MTPRYPDDHPIARCEHEIRTRGRIWKVCNSPAVCYEDHLYTKTGGRLRLFFCAKHRGSRRPTVPAMRVTGRGEL